MFRTLVFLAAMAAAAPAVAEMEIREFQAAKGNFSASTQTYIAGLYQGISWSNSKLVFDKRQPMYCPPTTFTLNYENVISMLTTHLEHPSAATMRPDTPIGVVLLTALVANFPCQTPPGTRM